MLSQQMVFLRHNNIRTYFFLGHSNIRTYIFLGHSTAPVTDMPDYFGPASFHENDYSFFYKNLQNNVAKRIAAYKAN